MSQRKPLFITFEGGEGSGKSTQVNLFSKFFGLNYGRFVTTREPGGVSISEQIRSVILDTNNVKMDSITELLLYEAARSQFVEEVVNFNLEKGKSVISDRFYDSTTAYQGYGRGLDLSQIEYLNSLASKERNPDLTFLIDVPVEIGLKNAKERGKMNRLDNEKKEFHERVRQGYLRIAEENPEKVVVIPYEDGIENVQQKIQNVFSERYLKL